MAQIEIIMLRCRYVQLQYFQVKRGQNDWCFYAQALVESDSHIINFCVDT